MQESKKKNASTYLVKIPKVKGGKRVVIQGN